MDPRSNRAFWRGTATEMIDHPEAPSARKIDKAVAKMIKRYPAAWAVAPRQTM